jgi:hypothetical protein
MQFIFKTHRPLDYLNKKITLKKAILQRTPYSG